MLYGLFAGLVLVGAHMAYQDRYIRPFAVVADILVFGGLGAIVGGIVQSLL